MHALFDEAGKFLAGRILSEAEASLQVELESGKRVKVKTANVLLKFEKPAPAELLGAAQALSESIELDLAWEFAPEDDFGFADLAAVYFQDPPTLPQQAGTLLERILQDALRSQIGSLEMQAYFMQGMLAQALNRPVQALECLERALSRLHL